MPAPVEIRLKHQSLPKPLKYLADIQGGLTEHPEY
jgi:hypothetical protein